MFSKNSNTRDLVSRDLCFCLKLDKIVNLRECKPTECHREKSCRTRSNNKYK